MFDRTIRCSIWESEPFLDLPSDTHRLAFIRLVNDADDFGNLEAGAGRMCRIFSSALMVKGERGALSILSALADADLIRLYQVEGRDYAHIPRFKNDRRYTSRKHPKSPWCGDAQTTLQRKQSCGLQAQSAAELRQICSRPAGDLRENSPSNTRVVPEQGERSANVVRTQDLKRQAIEVLGYLNRNAHKNFKPVPANLDMIVARLKEGYSPTELCEIAFYKCGEWGTDEKMAEYLRPKTLYNKTNCAQYHGTYCQPKETLDGMS